MWLPLQRAIAGAGYEPALIGKIHSYMLFGEMVRFLRSTISDKSLSASTLGLCFICCKMSICAPCGKINHRHNGNKTMATVTYPAALPKPLINITRAQSPGFQLKQPLAGPGYVKQMTSDSPATYELSWRMSRDKAMQFILWFESPTMLNKGANKFTISLDTEFGPQAHTFQLTPDNLLPSSQEASNVFSYSATAICRKVPIPAVYKDHADLILLDAYNYRAEIDIAMNVTWPEAL